MVARGIDAEIDRLYQLPLEEFTSERNALAKRAGADAPLVKKLTRPSVAAWAVNQLHWNDRPVYDSLVNASKELRQAHKTILAGRGGGDLRSSGKAHETAVDAALKAITSMLQASGHPATDATRQSIATTLRALPGDEPPGRLTRALQPGGFEMLSGLSIGPGPAPRPGHRDAKSKGAAAPSHQAAAKPAKSGATKEPVAEKRISAEAAARAREAAAKSLRELRETEHTARREEFEAARATRDAEKAARQLEQAREAFADAQQELEAAEAAASAAADARIAAERRSKDAARALDAAREKAAAASEKQ